MLLLNLVQKSYKNPSDLFHVYTNNEVYTFHYHVLTILKNVIHQIDYKNERFFLSGRFTAKFGLVLLLTLENTFS